MINRLGRTIHLTEKKIREFQERERKSLIRIKLWKVGTPEVALYPESDYGDKAGVMTGVVSLLPSPGESLFMLRDNGDLMGTSMVMRLLPGNQFQTLNSIYQYEILPNDQTSETDPGGLGESTSAGGDVPERKGDGAASWPGPRGKETFGNEREYPM